ncbi:hypothetical protein L0665_10130 [Methanogenium marinum]|uniref:HEPN domain-containing protein n=1 Tax=Methanogenium marinum TaxID=348610 RepID=A0A9Q4PWS0_9EURY|nr:hypothetical protein [Methanogenium marinum]MDE4908964.1 hypothetical protein [Methanogenium marinum]
MDFLFPIPDKKLSLFEPAENYCNAGYVYRAGMGNPDEIWGTYARGYLNAVDELIKSVLEGRLTRDTFGYPIFYLFSHYLELRFKEIMQIGRPLIGEDIGFSKGHDLVQLWGECKKILKEVYKWKKYSDLDKEGREIFLTIDHFVKELCQDKKAQTFRYPVDRDGKPLMKDSIDVLNIENLVIVTNWLPQALDRLCSGIYANKQLMDDFHAEMCAEYREDY